MGQLASRITRSHSGRIYTCKINTICEDDDDRKEVTAILTDRGMSVRAKARTLQVHPETVVKHLDKVCSCFRGDV